MFGGVSGGECVVGRQLCTMQDAGCERVSCLTSAVGLLSRVARGEAAVCFQMILLLQAEVSCDRKDEKRKMSFISQGEELLCESRLVEERMIRRREAYLPKLLLSFCYCGFCQAIEA